MGRRFNDLEKTVIDILSTGGSITTLPAAHPARKYWEWKNNPNSEAHNLPAGSERNRQEIVNCIISPFGYPIADNHTVVAFSKRSGLWARSQANKAVFHHYASTQDAIVRDNFKPAKAYLRRPTGTAENQETSRITGRRYKTKFNSSDQGYIVPFGKTGTATQSEAQEAIRAAYTDYSVSFQPEKVSPAKEIFDINA